MRVLVLFLGLLILFAVANVSIAQQPAGDGARGVPVVIDLFKDYPFKITAQYWRSEGTAIFRDMGFDPAVGPWEAELEYPMDGDFVILGAEYSFRAGRSKFSVDVNYGFSSNIEGTTRDWDWVSYDYDPLVYAESDTDGESNFLSADFYYRLYEWGPGDSVDVFAGYHTQQNSFTNSNARVLTPGYFTAPGKISDYEMDFSGVRAGVRAAMALSPRLFLQTKMAFLPYVDVDTRGNWLLRDLIFEQSADGFGVDFDVSLGYEVTPNITITAGLKYLYLLATDGEESGVAEGVPYGPFNIVDEIESDQFGVTAGALVTF